MNREYSNGDYIITTDKSRINLESVYAMLSKSYWASGRSKEIIERSINNSLCFSLLYKENQIGVARIITDYSVFAYICDVYLDENYRGNGLGKWLIDCIINYPELKGIKRWTLITKDAHELYKKYGFKSLSTPEKYMEFIP